MSTLLKNKLYVTGLKDSGYGRLHLEPTLLLGAAIYRQSPEIMREPIHLGDRVVMVTSDTVVVDPVTQAAALANVETLQNVEAFLVDAGAEVLVMSIADLEMNSAQRVVHDDGAGNLQAYDGTPLSGVVDVKYERALDVVSKFVGGHARIGVDRETRAAINMSTYRVANKKTATALRKLLGAAASRREPPLVPLSGGAVYIADQPVYNTPATQHSEAPYGVTLRSSRTGDSRMLTDIVHSLFEPLCEETKLMLSPMRLRKDDILELRLDKKATHFLAQTYRPAPYFGEIRKSMPSSFARTLKDRIPECTKLNDYATELSIACTDISAIVLHTIWPQDQMKFADPETRTIYDSMLVRWLHQTIASRQRAEYKLNKVMPEVPEYFQAADEHPQWPPNDYQRVALATTIDYESVALLMQQGTGKTPTTIWKIMAEAKRARAEDEHSCYKVIVVVPKNIRMNWAREVHKFATLPGTVTILRGGGMARIKLLCRAMATEPHHQFSIVVTSYETVARSWDALGMVLWDLAIADESHFIKNPNSKRTKSLWKLRDCAKKRMILTGTAVTNSLFDLWAQLEFLGEGFSGFHNYKKFKSFYGRYEKNEYEKEKQVGYQNVPFLQERLSRLAFMITKKEALPFLPEKTFDVTEVTMTKEQGEVYESLAASLVAELSDELNGEKEVSAVTVNNMLVKLLRLAQVTAGFTMLDAKMDLETLKESAPRRIRRFVPNPKLEQLVADVKSMGPNSKLLVYTVFVPTIHDISERFTREGIKHVIYYGSTSDEDREAAETAFNNDDSVQVFVGNPAACGVGLNLWGYNPGNLIPVGQPNAGKPVSEMNCDWVIRYSSNWSMVQRAQSDDRPHRIGTRKTVRYTDYVVPGSIDEEILTRVSGHMASAETIQDVKSIMKRVLETVPAISSDGDSVDEEAPETAAQDGEE